MLTGRIQETRALAGDSHQAARQAVARGLEFIRSSENLPIKASACYISLATLSGGKGMSELKNNVPKARGEECEGSALEAITALSTG